MIIIFANKDLADELTYEIAATPNDLVFMWWDPDDTGHWETVNDETTGETTETWISPKNSISYNTADDGRVAVSHHWSAEDVAWLTEYLSEVDGVTFADEWPIPGWGVGLI